MSQQAITIFSADIQENLFPANEFYKNSKADATGVDVNAKTFDIPEAGNLPSVYQDVQNLPLAVGTRVDKNYTYDLHEFVTEPQLIRNVDEAIANYSIRESLLKDHWSVLNDRIAKMFAYEWSPTFSTNIVRTTGAAGTSLAPGATGQRKKITKADLISVYTMLGLMDIPEGQMYALIDPQMYGELLEIDDFVDYNKTGKTSALEKGQIGEILGMKFYKRSKVQVYTNDAPPVKKAVNAATATSDNLSCLFWGESFVRRAEGSVKVLADLEKPQYVGSIFNAVVRAGGKYSRTDQKGVVALVQAHA